MKRVRKIIDKVKTAKLVWEQNGSVYTKFWIGDFILDFAGYVPSKNLGDVLTVEPYNDSGEILEAVVRRFVRSCKPQGRDIEEGERSLLALETDPVAIEQVWGRKIAALVP